jgi:uncharacterized membrane protein YkvI
MGCFLPPFSEHVVSSKPSYVMTPYGNSFNVIHPIVCCTVNEMSNKAINRASCVNSVIIYFIYIYSNTVGNIVQASCNSTGCPHQFNKHFCWPFASFVSFKLTVPLTNVFPKTINLEDLVLCRQYSDVF